MEKENREAKEERPMIGAWKNIWNGMKKKKNGWKRRGLCMAVGFLAGAFLFTACQMKELGESNAGAKETEVSESTPKESGQGNPLGADGKIILTAPDVFLMNIACGYRDEWAEIRCAMVMVENREQLDVSMDQCGASGKERREMCFPYLGEIWSKMPAEYPIEDYTYFFYYEEVSCGGYSLHADKLIIDGGRPEEKSGRKGAWQGACDA